MQLFDEKKGTFVADSWFVVSGERISERGVGSVNPSDFDAEEITVDNKFVMPGMINCHTHMMLDPVDPLGLNKDLTIPYLTKKALDNIQEMLETGITFFRDVGAGADIDIEVKKMIDSGELFGPDCIVSGTPIVMTGGHGYQMGSESDGADEVRKHTRQLLKKGVGCIKFMATGGVMTGGETPHDVQLSYEEMKAGIDEAHHKGRNTAAHAQGLQGVKNAILAGVDSIEHGVYLDDEAIQLFLDHGTYLCPTLVAPYYIVQAGTEKGIPAYMVEKSQNMLDDHMKSFRKAAEAGVKIVLGTDAGTPFNLFKNTPFELQLMTECGLSNVEAIYSATSRAAEMLKIDADFGTLETGKYADFIVLDKSPLADITILQQKKGVYKKGKKVV